MLKGKELHEPMYINRRVTSTVETLLFRGSVSKTIFLARWSACLPGGHCSFSRFPASVAGLLGSGHAGPLWTVDCGRVVCLCGVLELSEVSPTVPHLLLDCGHRYMACALASEYRQRYEYKLRYI